MQRLEGTIPDVPSSTLAVEGFSSPEEELTYLRERVREKEQELETHKTDFEQNRIAKREIIQYQDTPTEKVLKPTYSVSEEHLIREKLRLEPEEHDVQIDELLSMIKERGVKNTLSLVQKMGSAHLEDDVHRALVRYLAEGLPAKGLTQGSEEWKSLTSVLYEVSLPGYAKEEQAGEGLEKLLSAMEQFYAGLLSVVGEGTLAQKRTFSVEIAVQQGSEEVIFYVSVPQNKRQLFEKHLMSIFPDAILTEAKGDYNIFHYGGGHAGSYAQLQQDAAYPLKDYTTFTHDPLNVMLAAFSKLKKHGEGAAIQFVIGDNGDIYTKQYKKIIDHLREGKSAKKSVRYGTQPFRESLDLFGKTLGDSIMNRQPEAPKERVVDDLALEQVTKKLKSRVVPVNIRLLASAHDEGRANEILDVLASTFNQFSESHSNALNFTQEKNEALRKFLHAFTFRSLNTKRLIPLSLTELTTLCHLTGEGVSTSRELKTTRAKQVAAPLEVGGTSATPHTSTGAQTTSQPEVSRENEAGVVLGKNTYGGTETLVRFLPEDRMRHFYEIGQTGTGKTNLMKNMIIQDIKNGEGCCYIDPHGSDIVDILAAVPEDRYDDVIYFDPAYTQRPMGLNMMEFNPAFPEQKTFVVNEMFSIFEKLFLAKSPESLGPMFEQYFRNAAMLVLEGMPPNTATMADIPRVLANAQFRRNCLAHSKNPLVNQFWEEIAEKAGGEASLENIVPYITAKTDIFLGNSVMRPIITQEQSAFNFRDILDNRKILLVNLSKGRLGDLNAELLGLIIVGKFLQAALSRVDTVAQGGGIADFYLYIDEFQNFTTPSIATILSEARKYRLSLNVAHQFIAQLDDRIRDAVFGNVGTKCVFRVGIEDAEFLEKQFKPEFSAGDIAGLDNFNAYISLLVGGKPISPFNMQTLPPEPADFTKIEHLRQVSYERYGRDATEVANEIAEKYARQPEAPVVASTAHNNFEL